MARENLDLDIDVNGVATSIAQIQALRTSLNAISTNAMQLSERLGSITENSDRLDNSVNKNSRSLTRLNRNLKRFQGVLKVVTGPVLKFIKALGKFGFIALAGEIALFTAGLVAVKLALITGKAAANLYGIALKGVAVAAAGVATAVATAAAAIRQFNEASLSPYLGGGLAGRRAAARATRGLSPSVAGLLGGEGTTGVTTSLIRSGVAPQNINRIASTLFALSGGDVTATVGLAGAINKDDFKATKKAIEGASGFKEGSLAGVTTVEGLLSALQGNTVVKESFQNIGQELAQTFIGTMKTEFAGLKNFFADLGDPLIEPFRRSFLEISRIIKEDMLSIAGVIQQAGADSFAPTLVSLVDSISNFFRSNIIENIQSLDTFADSIIDFFRGVREFFADIGDVLRRFEPAANVVIDMFRAMGDAAGGRGLFAGFSDLVVANKDAFIQFGASIGNVIGAVFDLFKSGNNAFFNRLDSISETFNSIATNFVPMIGKLLEAFTPLFEALPGIIADLSKAFTQFAPILKGFMTILAAFATAIAKIASVLGGPLLTAVFALSALTKVLIMSVGAMKLYSGFMEGLAKLPPGVSQHINLKNAARIAGAGMIGYGLVDAAVMQTGGGLVGGLSAAGGVGLITRNARMAGAAGGLVAFGGGALSAKNDGIGVMNTAATVGGAALTAGATFAGMGGMSTLAITGIGALIGAAVLAGMTIWGVRSRDHSANVMADALDMYFEEFTEAGKMTAEKFFEGYNLQKDMRKAMEAGADTREFEQFINKYSELLGGLLGKDIGDMDQERLAALIEERDIEAKAIEAVSSAARVYHDNLMILENATGKTGEEILRLADSLGINLFEAIGNAVNMTTVLVADLNRIDPTRGILPDIESTSLFRTETAASANAALTELLTADELTSDLVAGYITSASALEVQRGADPITAAFGAIGNLRMQGERLGRPELTRLARELEDSQFSRIVEASGGALSEEDLRRAYNDKAYTDVYGNRILAMTSGRAIQGQIRAADQLESALAYSSTMDPFERIGILRGRYGNQMSGADRLRLEGIERRAAFSEESDEALNKVISDFLINTDSINLGQEQLAADQLAQLQIIAENTKTATTIMINGEEIPVGERTTTVLPNSNGVTVTTQSTTGGTTQGGAP